MTVLVCDLGGTGCRMALAERGQIQPASYRAMRNAEFGCFEDALAAYLGDRVPEAAAIALAAPVTCDDIALTNHDWRLSRQRIAERSGIASVHFLNDLEALGYALGSSERLVSLPVLDGRPSATGSTQLVLGVGTGFNSAARSRGGDVICSETGHTTFPVETVLDRWLQSDFVRRVGRCSLERVLSGAGLDAVYRGVCVEAGGEITLSGSMKIVPAALNGGDPLAVRACEELCRILGRTAGDLALTFMAQGGLWLAGGISRALAPMLTDPDGPFAAAFLAKGRMSDEMTGFPVRLLNDDTAALRGCVAWFERRQRAAGSRRVLETERAD